MDVQLYVYDLTHGMARTMSRQLLGIQIDAVYHTSIVFGNVEYFFGQGVQICRPGATHHGQPMEKIPLGRTQLPPDTIQEYLTSLKEIYTAESYDLFAHNCNNFSNDFAMFLVGEGIPAHITSLPRRVLETPFGQMLKPQIDASMRAVTQAPLPEQTNIDPSRTVATETSTQSPYGSVRLISDLATLDRELAAASSTAATIFFTSSTCAPCRLAYPAFDELAAQHPRALFVKVDINAAHDVAARYAVRATPTFVTFARGEKRDEWQGADPQRLRAEVERLVAAVFPAHPHAARSLPALQFGPMQPVTYARVPPLEKLVAKLGEAGKEGSGLGALRAFVERRQGDPRNAPLPDLKTIGPQILAKVIELPVEVRFAAVDLLRCAMVDPRVSGYFAEEVRQESMSSTTTVAGLITHVVEMSDCPHNLRLVTIHLACNLFTSPLWIKEMTRSDNDTAPLLVRLIASSLLDASHPTTRVAAASLAFNIAVANYRVRREENREALAESEQVELVASLVEALSEEDNVDASKALLLAVGYVAYYSPPDGEVMDLCKALDAKATIENLAKKSHGTLAREVASLL